jgi:hypothetical protein
MKYKYYKDHFRSIKCSSRASFGSICLLACVLFSSCNPSFEITKRRYNKGYYIDRSGNKDIAFITKEKATQVKITTPTYPPQTLVAEKPKVSHPVPMPTKGGMVMVAKDERQGHKKALATNMDNLPATSSIHTVSAIPGPQKIADDGDHHSERAALSLFWLIIVIVLILWLIGLIAGGFGLGAFINILLIIALILLILWLLRIV